MKQIDIKKPKYIIPILILPFILGIGWLVKDMINSAPAEETTLVETEELNLDIPDANLEKREIKSKFESLKGAFNKSSDYSSIQTIDKEEEVSEIESSGSLYSNDEIRQIDSLNQASRIREKELEQQIKGFPTIDESSQTETRKAPEKSKMQEEMELFKMQMAYIDSLQNPRPRTPQKKQDEKPKEKAIEVVKAKNPAEVYFRFLSVRLNRLKNRLLANYLRNRGNDLATVRNSAFCVAILSNNSFICKYNIFFRKYELSVAIL